MLAACSLASAVKYARWRVRLLVKKGFSRASTEAVRVIEASRAIPSQRYSRIALPLFVSAEPGNIRRLTAISLSDSRVRYVPGISARSGATLGRVFFGARCGGAHEKISVGTIPHDISFRLLVSSQVEAPCLRDTTKRVGYICRIFRRVTILLRTSAPATAVKHVFGAPDWNQEAT